MKVEELSCVRAETGHQSYMCLIDSGANVSCIEIGLIKKLGLEALLLRKAVKAQSWDGNTTQFIGTFVLDLEIGGERFAQTVYVANRLGSGTEVILGMDFLKNARADLEFRKEGVRLSIYEGKKFIHLTNPRKKQRYTNTLTVYDAAYAEKKIPVAWAMEHRRINPYISSMVKVTIAGENIPDHITLEHREIKPGLVVDPQVVTPIKNKPKPNAKCRKDCGVVCARFCPRKEYLYCWVYVYNATDKILLVTPETKIAEGEAIFCG